MIVAHGANHVTCHLVGTPQLVSGIVVDIVSDHYRAGSSRREGPEVPVHTGIFCPGSASRHPGSRA